MPVKLRHFFKCREHFFYYLKGPVCFVDAEIDGAKRRNKRKTDIRGRSAVSDADRRLLLIVVGRQKVILSGAEFIEICPYALGTLRQICLFVGRQHLNGLCRKGERKSSQGSDYPQKPDGFSKNAGRKNEQCKSRYRCKPHIETVGGNAALFALTLSGSLPFEQVFTVYAHAPQRYRRRA